MAEIRDTRGKHLLGEAVRLLVQSGATGAAITDFINEYSTVVAATLAAQEPVSDLKAQVKDALKEALQEMTPTAATRQRGKRGVARKQVNVLVEGVRTTLYLDQELWTKVTHQLGNPRERQKLVAEIAAQKPPEHPNRSAWVSEMLAQRLVLLQAEVGQEPQALH